MRAADTPLVTVICISYNQAQYIADALEGFLAQRTNFPFEVIVHDDASTDGTANVIRGYVKKYPGFFRSVLRTENQYSRYGVAYLDEMFREARGTYVCICEGDDYWTDPQKLQRQADLMEKHPEYGLCFHPVEVHTEGETATNVYPDPSFGTSFTLEKLLKGNFIQTNSVMYRKTGDYKHMPANVMPKDWYNNLYHARAKKIGFVKQTMAVYRRHKGSMWWESDKDLEKIWLQYGMPHLSLYAELLKLYGDTPRYARIINRHIITMLERLAEVDAKRHAGLLRQATAQYPDQVSLALEDVVVRLHALAQKSSEQTAQIADLDVRRADAERELTVVRTELALIKASRVWKLRGKAARVLGKK